MNGAGKTIGGIILLLIGASMILGMLGIHIGGLISFAIAVAFIYFGLKHIKDHNKVLGAVLLVVGLLIFLGSIPFLIGLVIAGICLYFGWKLLRGPSNSGRQEPDVTMSDDSYNVSSESGFDAQWRAFMEKGHHY